MAELADASDLKSEANRRAGSSPAGATKCEQIVHKERTTVKRLRWHLKRIVLKAEGRLRRIFSRR